MKFTQNKRVWNKRLLNLEIVDNSVSLWKLQSCKSPCLLSFSPCAFPCICLCCHLCASSFPSLCLGAFYQRNPYDRYNVINKIESIIQQPSASTILSKRQQSYMSRSINTHYLLPYLDFSRSLSFLWSLCLCSLSLYLSLCLWESVKIKLCHLQNEHGSETMIHWIKTNRLLTLRANIQVLKCVSIHK